LGSPCQQQWQSVSLDSPVSEAIPSETEQPADKPLAAEFFEITGDLCANGLPTKRGGPHAWQAA